jgi:hypothetical protein
MPQSWKYIPAVISSTKQKNNASTKTVTLRRPENAIHKADPLPNQFLMLEYIRENWHWHLQKCWEVYASWPIGKRYMPEPEDWMNLISNRQTSFKFRPWLRDKVPFEKSNVLGDNLVH